MKMFQYQNIKFPDLWYGPTIADILDVSLNFLQTLINVVEGGEPDIPLDLCPGG